ncbi:MAG: hypothetical protein Q9157_007621 [Trypethelium eluteriae]
MICATKEFVLLAVISTYVVPLYIGHNDETDEHEADAAEEVVLLAYCPVENILVLANNIDVELRGVVELDKAPDGNPDPLDNEAGLEDDDPKAVDTGPELAVGETSEALEYPRIAKSTPWAACPGLSEVVK